MTDITIQYDWNNHKEMNQKRLIDTFIRLELHDKLKVYRTLKEKRRLLLRKGYDQWKQEFRKKRFENYKMFVVSPLGDYMDPSDIKTRKEMMITLAIILEGTWIGYYEDLSSNYSKERESFEKTKNKMVDLYETMWIRRHGMPVHDEHDFYVKLKNIEYVSPPTFASVLKYKKEEWVKCYVYIGVGKDRAERLAGALAKRVKLAESYDSDTFLEANIKYMSWKEKIDQWILDEAQTLYALTRHYADEDL